VKDLRIALVTSMQGYGKIRQIKCCTDQVDTRLPFAIHDTPIMIEQREFSIVRQ
jgi:hypothetical protein